MSGSLRKYIKHYNKQTTDYELDRVAALGVNPIHMHSRQRIYSVPTPRDYAFKEKQFKQAWNKAEYGEIVKPDEKLDISRPFTYNTEQ